MKKERRWRFSEVLVLWAAIASSLLLLAGAGMAADAPAGYPSQPFESVVGNAPGSNSDMFARMVADIIQKGGLLNQPVMVNNKPGGGGAVAYAYLSEKKGNPYFFMIVVSPTLLGTPMLQKVAYSYKSFTPICNMALETSVLTVRADSRFKTAEDIIAEAKKRPKELVQGGANIAGFESLMGRSIQKATGTQWKFISFAGGNPEALVNLLGGNVDFILTNPANIRDHVAKGAVRVLLAGTPNRLPEYKDARTIKEAGMGEHVPAYRGVLGPPNMPDYAIKKVEEVMKKVLESERFKKLGQETGMGNFWMSSSEYGSWLNEENDRMRARLTAFGMAKY